ncbi:MAG: outer membrane protein assembly factor BamA [Candidatus Sedimenticola endophacoides]|uniref:Outer membrane protein assembly factor BamA n=1 Tax=Candidatus Sedimenticola endophacoides TaxID=2548426 RepID=A0A657PPR4_9GAMM|nr:MAG: outer membrane protein assembly factor BamA [Candidatus Sedimenticola endophacoides]OQX35532.1 MAG: outer membrane protein assembly factor BamA [Candidatus Sedimenticola endophacoides]OQX40038.1 MAG: outer membrane protein assembly factor BamA [Candidatus Sedimenticola endophacoides]OQX44706.1 MAG: outer membrane protein assembly factor BamA [Candidatus Sedimenticola endophacoides]PUD98907.1 MAG: outer membrane protein assembly factor BamA [Candidatus Sedimenticola endophacoides]
MSLFLKFVRYALLLLALGPLPVMAETFVVKDIRVEGLQRISPGTVFNYLPVKIGQRIEASETSSIIRELFKTGFFQDVRLEREEEVLIVFVSERPAIAKIEIEGNKSIESENLLLALKDIGLAEGRVFNRSILDKIEQELQRQYFSQGKYGVRLESTVTPLERNRVAVNIDISEGVSARIKKINLIGNDSFEEEDLLDEFTLSTTGYLSSFTKDDQYSREKLGGDLERLRTYYLDRGYLNFKIDSTQVSITPDKKDIYVTVNLTEGEVYTISDIKLAGELVVEKEEIFPMIRLRRGEVFSRKVVIGSAERVTQLLGNNGYAFANVNSIPEIDEENRQVAITYFVDPGKRVYVRRINVRGNSQTRDEVLRREMRQMEAGWFSTDAVTRSKERLQRLGYFDEVNVETPAVPGSTDQVDVNFKVVEKPMGQLTAGLGFSQSAGFIFSTSLTQNNFLGTGKRVSVAFDNSDSNTYYRFGYTNPYYTLDGVSRGFNLSYRKTDFDEVDTANYLTDTTTAGINFGVPITETDRVNFTLDLVGTDYKLGASPSTEIAAFATDNGDSFLDFKLGSSWVRDSRDSALLPTKGARQSFSADITVPGSDLEYYKLAYNQKRYFPLSDTFTLALNGDLGYGDVYGDTTRLPYWENYFAGGTKSVRGYKDYSLGPRDSANDPLGGNVRLAGGAELFFPAPFKMVDRSVRLGVFLDAGGVFDTAGGADIDFDGLRYSTGLSFFWLSPMGPLGASLSMPLNEKSGDETEIFQFTFGTAF